MPLFDHCPTHVSNVLASIQTMYRSTNVAEVVASSLRFEFFVVKSAGAAVTADAVA